MARIKPEGYYKIIVISKLIGLDTAKCQTKPPSVLRELCFFNHLLSCWDSKMFGGISCWMNSADHK